jgi:hypothetical protein
LLKIEDGEIIQFRASSLGKLLRIVGFQFKNYCAEMRLLYSTYGKVPSVDQINELCPEYLDRSIVATVFTGMAIEAFLFDYAVVGRSKTYAEKISQIPTSKEFLAIAKELLNSDTEVEHLLAERLTAFNDVRNHFVHNKSTDLGKYNNKDLEYLSPNGCVELLCDLFQYFSEVDEKYVLSSVTLKVLEDMLHQERGF